MRLYPQLRCLAIATFSPLFWGVAVGLSPGVEAQPVHDFLRSDEFQQTINGIFSPRSSEEFFDEGRLRFEEEIRNLQEESGDRPPILEIDESIMIQQEEGEHRDYWLFDDHVPEGY